MSRFLRPHLLLLLGLVLVSKPAHADDHATAIHERLTAAVVGITCTGNLPGAGEVDFYGTGAVVRPDGYIISNITVVPAGAWNIRVYFTDGRILDAELVRTDASSEAALIRVAADDLVFMPLADASAVEIGDPVYTWGNPFGSLQQDGAVSLSTGVVSGRYHTASVDDQSRYIGPVIETDAAVNPGSDGGPLTDHRGHLIGIQSLAFDPNRWLGLNIPSDVIYAALPELHDQPLSAGPKRDALAAEWPLQHAFQSAHHSLAPSIVTITRHADDKALAKAPATWPEAAAERTAIPRRLHARAERVLAPDAATSGVIIDPSGVIVTSAFGLGMDNQIITVYLADGTRHTATMLARNGREDVALLHIDAGRELPAIGLSALAPPPSTTPVALLSRSQTGGSVNMTLGRIGARQRDFDRLFQHSALLNYGALGGAIIDADGRLLGIASMLNPRSRWRQNCGVGFALRADRLVATLADLRNGVVPEDTQRVPLGLRPAPSGSIDGLAIAAVNAQGIAGQAGLTDEDVITAIDGEPVSTWGAAWHQLSGMALGTQRDLTVLRDGTPISLTLTAHSQADDEEPDDETSFGGDGETDDESEDAQ